MAENTSIEAGATSTGANETKTAEQSSQLESELSEELNRLGKSFVDVLKVAWESDQRRQLEQDLKTGLNSLASNLEDGFHKVSESPQTKEFVERAEDVAESMADRIRKSEVAQEIGVGLLKGLRSLGAQLEKLTTELQKQSGEASSNAPADKPAEDVPIEKG
jgi:hypothetical protein